ncbi:CHAT domain containing protein [Lactarius tabidus]
MINAIRKFTPAQLEEEILDCQRLLALASTPRSDPRRAARLQWLATLRMRSSDEKDVLDKSITHLTEAVLLPFRKGRDVVWVFFSLTNALFARFLVYKRPEDVVSSLKYFRYLRFNFRPHLAFDVSQYYELTSFLVQALAHNLMSESKESGDVTLDMEEMTALTHELLTSNTSGCSRGKLTKPLTYFALACLRKFRQCDPTQQVPERIIQVLRLAAKTVPNIEPFSIPLARCLATRFETTHAIAEYEEAIDIADTIFDDHPGDSETSIRQQEVAVRLTMDLLATRMNSFPCPEYLLDSIRRINRLLLRSSSPDYRRNMLTSFLRCLEQQRFTYFGIPPDKSSTETPLDPSQVIFSYYTKCLRQVGSTPDDSRLLILRRKDALNDLLGSIRDNKSTDVEATVECGRALSTSLDLRSDSSDIFHFADILFEAHKRTAKLDYLEEAITTYRVLRKVAGTKDIHFLAANGLLRSLLERWYLSHNEQDFEEVMELYAALVDDPYAEVFHRFTAACNWASDARRYTPHQSILAAYQKAMSLMQETVVFSPTLQTQHFRLVDALSVFRGLPSDYASYQIEMSQDKLAIETLEQGRALLWSEMRGFRTSTDKLLSAHPPFADKLTAINRRLESVTMSVAQSEEIGDRGSGNRPYEEMDSIDHLVATQRQLLEERGTLISEIQSLPGFHNFLRPPSFDTLNSVAAYGPVIIVNQSQWRSDIIILVKDSPPSIIPFPSEIDLYDRANKLKEDLLRVRQEKGPGSNEYGDALASVLTDLYELVGRPVIERLVQLNVPKKSRVWWCPTGSFCSLPLHAMGPILSDDGKTLYFMDLYITSYTPSLTALIESRNLRSLPESSDKPSLLLVAQPETLPGAWEEIEAVKATETLTTPLISGEATPKIVVEHLKGHQFAHFVCHGGLEPGRPFDASFVLHGGELTLLDIVRSQLPTAEFAFLAACHTAELTEDSIADEGLHLAAAMQYCGFRSVVGTMWAMADEDGADLSKHFYRSIFSESKGRKRPYYERSAKALQFAVMKLRKKRWITLERWVNFVHYGA